MENCVFCKIVKDEIPSFKVWEDDKALAFLNIMPHKKGHILLIPKEHEDYFFDLDDETIKDLVIKAKPLAKVLKQIYKPATGKVSLVLMGMGVAHVHLHLFPLDKESDINTNKAYKASEEELSDSMEKIRSALSS